MKQNHRSVITATFGLVAGFQLAGFSGLANAHDFVEEAKLFASESNVKDYFSSEFALSNGQLFVTSPGSAVSGFDRSGAVFVFEKDAAGIWTEVTTLLPADPGPNQNFGSAVDVSGNIAVIGADGSPPPGAAYIYERDTFGNWRQVQKIVADEDLPGAFGQSVSLVGDTILVGDLGNSDFLGAPNKGAVFAFNKDATGLWIQTQKIRPSNFSEITRFGWAMDADGDTAVIGSDRDHAYVFHKSADNVWREQAILTAPDNQSAYDHFGDTVAIAGNTVVIGSGGHVHDGYEFSGSAYVFERDSSGSWILVQEIFNPDPSPSGSFAIDVEIDDSAIYIGSWRVGASDFTGAVYEYHKDGLGKWQLSERIVSSDLTGGDTFGSWIESDNGSIVVNAPGADKLNIADAGAVYVFSAVSADDLIQSLIATVLTMNLRQGIDNALDAKLDAVVLALDDVNDNNDVSAINMLVAFIQNVEAQRGAKITDAQADELISGAQAIISALSQ